MFKSSLFLQIGHALFGEREVELRTKETVAQWCHDEVGGMKGMFRYLRIMRRLRPHEAMMLSQKLPTFEEIPDPYAPTPEELEIYGKR